jgi:Cu/Ag efflux pump CusA
MTETSFQAQFLVPMATSLVFGLAATTLIVLVLVPVMYSFFGTSARSVIIDDESDWQEVEADSAAHAMV